MTREKHTATVVVDGPVSPPFADFHDLVLQLADIDEPGAWVQDFPSAITDDDGNAIPDVWAFRVCWYES